MILINLATGNISGLGFASEPNEPKGERFRGIGHQEDDFANFRKQKSYTYNRHERRNDANLCFNCNKVIFIHFISFHFIYLNFNFNINQ